MAQDKSGAYRAASASVGFFGKLPGLGDVVERRLNGAFREVWDDWLQRSLAASRQTLGDRWLNCYLSSPPWRFFLSDGVIGAASYAGVLVPSVDRAGRYFPLTVVTELPVGIAALEFAQLAASWFKAVEKLCALAVRSTQPDFTEFDRAISETSERIPALASLHPVVPFPGRAMQWRWSIPSVNDLPAGLASPLMAGAHAALRPLTMWWTEGSDFVRGSLMLVRGLPRADSFVSLLTGTWDDGRWDGEVSVGATVSPDVRVPSEPSVEPNSVSHVLDATLESPVLSSVIAIAADPAETLELPAGLWITSGGMTDSGPVRKDNQDNFLLRDDHLLWAVADGMGRHKEGEVASLKVMNALAGGEPDANLQGALEFVNTAMLHVNDDLRRTALTAGGGERSGSTVVSLVIRGLEWGVTWAGDSRAYLFRAGILTQLTQDHTTASEVKAAANDIAPGISASTGELTRAVGGDDSLQLDQVADYLSPGDRFLLCSDGLHGSLDPEKIAECLRSGGSALKTSAILIASALSAGARDNVTAVVVDVKAAA